MRTLCTVVALYWKGETAESDGPMRNGDKVVEVLKKAGKVGSSGSQVLLAYFCPRRASAVDLCIRRSIFIEMTQCIC